jgi:hypothetical protein
VQHCGNYDHDSSDDNDHYSPDDSDYNNKTTSSHWPFLRRLKGWELLPDQLSIAVLVSILGL